MIEINHNYNSGAGPEKIQGLTLVEVMIALVILSVGLLGLAGLQIHGLRGTGGANSRVQATFIVSDMAERMHANSVEFSQNLAYQNIALAANNCGNPPTDCDTGACSTAQLVAHDNYKICQAMGSLPSGATLTVTCDDNPCVAGLYDANNRQQSGSTHTLTLTWSEVRDASLGGNLNQTITMSIQPFLPQLKK